MTDAPGDLGRTAKARLRESLAQATFETDAGPEATANFLGIADRRVRARTGREPTSNQLDTAIASLATESTLVMHVGDKTLRSTVAEYAQRTEPPARPEIVFGLLYDGVRTGVYTFNVADSSFSVVSSITDALAEATDFTAWGQELGKTAGGRLIEVHPTRAGAVSVVIPDNPTPPANVPLVLVDVGFGTADPGRVSQIAEVLFTHGLAPVGSLNQVYPAVFDWSYQLTTSADPAKNRIHISAGGDPGRTVYDGILLTNSEWLRIEESLRAIVVAIGNFSFLDHDPYAPGFAESRLREVTNATLALGQVLGATIRR